MQVVFAALSGVSALVLVAGLIWWLAGRGETVRRSGPEVGAEIMGSSTGADGATGGATLLDKSAFVGGGIAVERSASVSYAEVKRMLRERDWQDGLPPLLAMLGLYFFIVFGAIALWFAFEDKLVATVIAAVVLFTMARIGYDFIRS